MRPYREPTFLAYGRQSASYAQLPAAWAIGSLVVAEPRRTSNPWRCAREPIGMNRVARQLSFSTELRSTPWTFIQYRGDDLDELGFSVVLQLLGTASISCRNTLSVGRGRDIILPRLHISGRAVVRLTVSTRSELVLALCPLACRSAGG